MKRFFVLLSMLLVISHVAWGSGDEPTYDRLVSRWNPDISLDQYESGELGVILPTYSRVYLYPAWRAILLGKVALSHEKRESDALNKACCGDISSWIDEQTPNEPLTSWLKERAVIVAKPPRTMLALEKVTSPDSYTTINNCNLASYSFALSTLQALRKRSDGSPERLKAWVSAQDAAFEFCGYTKGLIPYGATKTLFPPPVVPKALPLKETKFWRQLRDYQIATAYFYALDFKNAQLRFEAIARDADHPMYVWGEYLALRTAIRQASLTMKEPISQNRADLEARVTKILNNPALSKVHPYASASLRLIKFRFNPEGRLKELSASLNDWKRNPHVEDKLADWRRLADQLIDYNDDSSLIDPMRKQYEYFDWMRTIQRCNGNLVADKVHTCQAENQHALDMWHQSAKLKRPEARAWLLATLMTSSHLDAEVVNEAKKVAQSAPEYLTLQYYLVKNLRLNNQAQQARLLADVQLEKGKLSRSATNLFLEERFALSTDLQDAAKHLLRSDEFIVNLDTKEVLANQKPSLILGDDGLSWLNYNLPIVDLIALSKMETLPQSWRTRIALMAWARADLLDKTDLAKDAVSVVEKTQPSLKLTTQAYLNATDKLNRQHVMLVAGVLYPVSPIIGRDIDSLYTYQPLKPEQASANMWCSFDQESNTDRLAYSFKSNLNAGLKMSTDKKTKDVELASLSKLPVATSYFVKHVIEYAQRYPNDPQVPWLLHVAVVSTKGGCVGKDNHDLSVKAYKLLHSKYKNSVWAKKTPYWY